MEQIIVAVDFSKNSLQAVEAAMFISQKTGAKVTLVWVEKQELSDSINSKSDVELRNDAKSRLNDIIENNNYNIKKSLLAIKLRKGKICNEIVAQAIQSNADLIIVGSQASTGFEDVMMGSNTFRIATYSKCPVLIIPNGFSTERGFDNIVIPIDSTSETCRKVRTTAEFAKQFNLEDREMSPQEEYLKNNKKENKELNVPPINKIH